MKTKTLLLIICLLVTGCVQINSQPTESIIPDTPTIQPTMSTLPNPASVYCEQQGYTSEIRTATDSSQSGVCIFPDGSECDEWAYNRKECAPASEGGSLPNPASVFCEQQGYTLEIRTAADGSQSGVCVFPDGSECDEWAYFRGECTPAIKETPTGPTDGNNTSWAIYTNEVLRYSFQYPAEAEIIANDEPSKSLNISGTGMGNVYWGIAHPSDRVEYRPPEGADLSQWLTDHYLLGEERLPDEQIAGTTAIHFRHEASPQSSTFDQYYFARAGQLYQVIIGNSTTAEDWELSKRFLQSFQFEEHASDSTKPTPIPTALPIDPTAYQDWTTYTNSDYGFSIRLPDNWIVEEVTGGGPGMDGHILNLHPVDDFNQENIRLTFRRAGEEILLWPTGVGQGDFILQGTLSIAGEPSDRVLLVCPTGEVTSIWYRQAADQPNITRSDLEFGIIYSSSPIHCEAGYSLSGEVQLVGEMIISSLQVP
jgi:putative hemolysin